MADAKTKTKVKLKLKRGDTVEVIAGKDKGKRGTIRDPERGPAGEGL